MAETELAVIRDELNWLATQYKEKYITLYEKCCRDIVSWQYGRGGVTIHRGWYCPSPVRDIVIGNAGRGKLLKKEARCGKPADYKYGFDANGELLIVDGPYSELHKGYSHKEFIIKEDLQRLGLRFEEWCGKTRLCSISICKYREGKLIEYILSSRPDVRADTISSFEREQYSYGGNGELVSAEWTRWSDLGDLAVCANVPMTPLIRKTSYTFLYDDEGCLSRYIAQTEDGWACEYPVLLKRKM